jgi:hypothetical protein
MRNLPAGRQVKKENKVIVYKVSSRRSKEV